MKSTDYNTKDGPEFIVAMTTVEEILAFIEGDERKTVIDAANKRIAEIRGPKQGEQNDPITQKTSDFKASGVEGTKSDSSSLTTDHSSLSFPHSPRSYVTCEDVLENMRAKGKNI